MKDVKTMDQQGKLKRNLINPPLKDTVQIPSGGYTIFRFLADNPGYWLMHCHVEFHSESGMAVLFKVGNEAQFPPMPVDWPQCGSYTKKRQNSNGIYLFSELSVKCYIFLFSGSPLITETFNLIC